MVPTDDATLLKFIHFSLDDQINEQDENESNEDRQKKFISLKPEDIVPFE